MLGAAKLAAAVGIPYLLNAVRKKKTAGGRSRRRGKRAGGFLNNYSRAVALTKGPMRIGFGRRRRH